MRIKRSVETRDSNTPLLRPSFPVLSHSLAGPDIIMPPSTAAEPGVTITLDMRTTGQDKGDHHRCLTGLAILPRPTSNITLTLVMATLAPSESKISSNSPRKRVCLTTISNYRKGTSVSDAKSPATTYGSALRMVIHTTTHARSVESPCSTSGGPSSTRTSLSRPLQTYSNRCSSRRRSTT